MEINYPEEKKPTVKFNKVSDGKAFIGNNTTYIKIKELKSDGAVKKNAICLHTGEGTYFGNEADVTIVEPLGFKIAESV